ncbi:hypothetical protein [Pseudomonas sp. DSP3-2-2]|uniref:hypothetical protein n=1 Tax=unclassified Pseudomonas TaxID=196821 RepID=UPI003CE74B96
MVIDFSKEATYTDSTGAVISAFQRDQTPVRVIAKHDFGPRHVESIADALIESGYAEELGKKPSKTGKPANPATKPAKDDKPEAPPATDDAPDDEKP